MATKTITIYVMIMLVLAFGCSTQEQKSYDQINVVSLGEQKAIFAAKPYIDRLEQLGFDLILKDITSDGNTYSLYYYFDDGSGPLIVEVKDETAYYLIMDGEKEPIEESIGYMEKGAELLR
jgi:capsid portal protein